MSLDYRAAQLQRSYDQTLRLLGNDPRKAEQAVKPFLAAYQNLLQAHGDVDGISFLDATLLGTVTHYLAGNPTEAQRTLEVASAYASRKSISSTDIGTVTDALHESAIYQRGKVYPAAPLQATATRSEYAPAKALETILYERYVQRYDASLRPHEGRSSQSKKFTPDADASFDARQRDAATYASTSLLPRYEGLKLRQSAQLRNKTLRNEAKAIREQDAATRKGDKAYDDARKKMDRERERGRKIRDAQLKNERDAQLKVIAQRDQDFRKQQLDYHKQQLANQRAYQKSQRAYQKSLQPRANYGGFAKTILGIAAAGGIAACALWRAQDGNLGIGALEIITLPQTVLASAFDVQTDDSANGIFSIPGWNIKPSVLETIATALSESPPTITCQPEFELPLTTFFSNTSASAIYAGLANKSTTATNTITIDTNSGTIHVELSNHWYKIGTAQKELRCAMDSEGISAERMDEIVAARR